MTILATDTTNKWHPWDYQGQASYLPDEHLLWCNQEGINPFGEWGAILTQETEYSYNECDEEQKRAQVEGEYRALETFLQERDMLYTELPVKLSHAYVEMRLACAKHADSKAERFTNYNPEIDFIDRCFHFIESGYLGCHAWVNYGDDQSQSYGREMAYLWIELATRRAWIKSEYWDEGLPQFLKTDDAFVKQEGGPKNRMLYSGDLESLIPLAFTAAPHAGNVYPHYCCAIHNLRLTDLHRQNDKLYFRVVHRSSHEVFMLTASQLMHFSQVVGFVLYVLKVTLKDGTTFIKYGKTTTGDYRIKAHLGAMLLDGHQATLLAKFEAANAKLLKSAEDACKTQIPRCEFPIEINSMRTENTNEEHLPQLLALLHQREWIAVQINS
jgi:hypothetical protein